jgi:hypothetical protein
MRRIAAALVIALLGSTLALAGPAAAQEADVAALAAQKTAMGPLDKLNGQWRGTAWAVDRSGKRTDMIQTERVGPMLDGSIKLVEGRGYSLDGDLVFNAFAVISYDPARKTYSMKTFAQGRGGEFPLTVTDDGFSWSIPAGPGATIRYTAVIKGDSWVESGEFVAEGRPPFKFIEMNLKRIGDTDWPSAAPVGPK